MNKEFGVNDIRIPIEKLFGIKVYVKIGKVKRLFIYSRTFLYDEDNPDYVYTLFTSDKLNTFEEGIELIKKLKYNNIKGCFQLKEEEEDISIDETLYYYETFKEFNQIECNINNCCVCQELVETKTSCNHYICLHCAVKIIPIKNEYDFNETPCPICRKDISYGCNFNS